jgi:CubicO group peptidase (beta-lactamase class C family)
MIKSMSLIIAGLLFVASSGFVFGNIQKTYDSIIGTDELDEFILNAMEERHIPGISASIVLDETVIWQKAYGYANIENNVIVTNNTLFKIASVSKTVTATALMQLYEQDYIDLDDPINDYLPFNVVNPSYPYKDITFHMLLTHSSSIRDNWNYLFHFVGDSPIPYQTFLEEYLVPGGEYYDSENNFWTWEPGSSWSYSNVAVALVGYLVEIISEQNFTDYCESYIFNPLDMTESAWYLRDLDVDHIAMPYYWNGEEYIPYGHIGWVDVPAGDLRTSSSQLINFLAMYINNGTYNSEVILESDTVDLMLSSQLPFFEYIGLIWWKSDLGSRTVWGHGGSDYGARALMQFDNFTKIGVVVLSNGESYLNDIAIELFDYGEVVLNNCPPDKPIKVQGQIEGKIHVEYYYNTSTVDPENGEIYYIWDWGNGLFSEWLGPYSSGEECNVSYVWHKEGSYDVRVKAKDEFNKESSWSDTLSVTMPKNKAKNTDYFSFFEFQPFIFLLKLIQVLFQRL